MGQVVDLMVHGWKPNSACVLGSGVVPRPLYTFTILNGS